MSIEIRGECHGDEDAIDVVECRAFEDYNEAGLVRLMRDTYPGYSRKYSVTAWDQDRLVGHALFTPLRARMMGGTKPALAVGPVSVDPHYQGHGVGGEMLRYGHELGRDEGYAFSFLLGHASYYPRHGYKPCFGFARVKLDRERLPEPKQRLQAMPVVASDLSWLAARCAVEWADVDFGWLWGPHLSEWRLPGLNSVVWWTEDGERAGYSVARIGHGQPCAMLLAADADLALDVLGTLRPAALFHHPSGWLARHVLDDDWAQAEIEPSTAAMACELEDGALAPYFEAIERRDRKPGHCNYPLPFLMC